MISRAVLFALLFLGLGPLALAYDTHTNDAYTTEQAKEDYRLFLQKLKEINAQYKQITGEMAQVMKDEGVPTWDTGGLDQQLGELFPQEPELTVEGVTIKDGDKELVITVDLPGIQKKSLKTSIQEGNKLNITADKKTEAETKKVQKLIQLPSQVDPKPAKAKYEDGVLTIRLKKAASQDIPISVE